MENTSNPIVWDFYRKVDGAKGLGSVTHYFNENSQSIYLNEGMATKTAEVPEGHWGESKLSEETKITNDLWTLLRIDHPANNCWYGAVSDGKSLTFIRYIYGLNLSEITESWDWGSQNDSDIVQFNGNVLNINHNLFNAEASLLQPGAQMSISILMGDSDPYPIGIIWLDEAEGDNRSNTIKISGRNTIGYYLKDQTFDEKISYNDTAKNVIESIFKHAGLTKYIIQGNETKITFEFNPADSLLSAIEKIKEHLETADKAFEITELSDGTIVIGYEDWIESYLSKGYYTFDRGRDVFTRKTRKSADGAYTSLYVTGKTSTGTDLQPVIRTIETDRYWSLGKHKTKHISAPSTYDTQEELEAYADVQVKKYNGVGITEDFTGPFRPQMIVGDVAVTTSGDENVGTVLGIITEVRHTFSIKNGFRTEFSVDSGGVEITDDQIIVYARAAELSGINRKQKVIDLIRNVSSSYK